ncbi:PREDICTED: G-protein coupled receptor 124 [Chaetura pelagica]|uniref:G-protein coupled receptor 124 n=1 Tax=Chaetura pelagica TaxID=8897 RepID=UPI000523A5E9|nr:PREDICTED: G-protein coupled receptor 124 [Chaetura pelagica]
MTLVAQPGLPSRLNNSLCSSHRLLSNNKITVLENGSFFGLRALEKLDLKNNLISTVQPGAFLGLPELKRLDLSNNRIGCLSASVFQGLSNLLRLNMSGNIFSSLPPGVFDELPSLKVVRQVVSQGDRLPFQCTATYLDNSTRIRWYHNQQPVQEDEQTGVIVEESLIHDCTFITSELILSNIHVSANGEWECAVSTSQGNVSKKVEIVVLETSASYCPAERVTNNRGDFSTSAFEGLPVPAAQPGSGSRGVGISLARDERLQAPELSGFPSEARGAGEVLHPAMYTCTAVLLLCLFTTIITYIVNHGKTPIVGIILHYSSLSTLLWMAVKARVLYKEVTWKAPRQPEGDVSQLPPRPMLRFYLIAGGIPLIICGITAAVNIHNYHDNNPYCWLVWRPSLGAFYVPVAFILLVTWIYFLCAGLSLQCRPSRRKDIPEQLEPPPRLGGAADLLTDSGSISVTLNSGPSCPEVDGVYSLQVQFWALVTTHALYVALWIFGAMAVSQRWYLNIVFSCLYGVTAVALGLFIFIHHCVRRRDVLNSWFSCCPSYRNALPMQAYVHPGLVPEDGSQVFIGCDPEAARSGASSSPSSAGSAGGRCKLTNLQVAQSQGSAAEREAKRRSYPLNVASHNGGLKGSKYDINLASADSVAGMKTGLWKSETTV